MRNLPRILFPEFPAVTYPVMPYGIYDNLARLVRVPSFPKVFAPNFGDSIFNYLAFGFGPLFAGRSNRSNSFSKRSTNDTSPSGRPLRSCFFSKASSSSSVKVRKLCQSFTMSNNGFTFTS